MLIPTQIQEGVNELNNKRSNEMTRLTYLQKLEDLNTYVYRAIRTYKNKSVKKMSKSVETSK